MLQRAASQLLSLSTRDIRIPCSGGGCDIYSVLRPINVSPTKLLVQMAYGRNIPKHYISSADVVSAEGVEIPAGSAAKYPPRVDRSNGYVELRWAYGQILEHAVFLNVPV